MAVMKISTFAEDLFGLSDFAERIEKFIKIEHDYVEGGLVVALSSKFGSGKTTFFQMWKSKMETSEEQSDKPFVISLNAWESDYYGDPLFAIISSLVDCLQEKGKSADSLVEAAKDFGWFATAIGRQIAKKMSGIDPLEAGEFADKKKTDRNTSIAHLPMDTFSIYQGRKDAMKKLKEAIQNFVEASEPRVLNIRKHINF